MTINYTLNWADDTLKPPFTLVGGSSDTTSTSLTLTGKGFVNWGEPLQENMLHVLEHFYSANPPIHPTKGQLWYDVSTNLLKVYNNQSVWVAVCAQCGGTV